MASLRGQGRGERTFAFKPSLHIASQSSLDCSEARGLVNSIFKSTYQYRLPIHRPNMTHIIYTKIIQRFRDFNLFGSVEEGIRKLLSFSQSALDDLETGYVAQEIADGFVWI